MTKALWELKYRPKDITEYVFQNERQKEVITKFIEDKNIPHLLLSGHRGTGKTSLAMVLKKELEIDDSDFLVVNGSRENDVDTMRNKIHGFISTFAMSRFKVVFIDEADRMSKAAQDAAKSMLEEFADNARFILTSNHPNKIINELRSRCLEVPFKKMDKYDNLERLAFILKNEKVKSDVATLEQYVNLAYPDLRKTIQLAQANSINGKLMPPSEIDPTTEVNLKIVELMESNKYSSIRDVLAAGMADDDWEQLYRFLYETLDGIGKFENSDKWKAGIIIIADHLYKHSIVADPEINAMAMFIRLGEV